MDLNYKIIAVDFDGTLCYSNWPELGAPNTMLIDYLLPEIVEFYGNNSRKITCDLYIDDKSAFIDSMGRIRGAGL